MSVSFHLTSSWGGPGEISETSFHFTPRPAMLGLFPMGEAMCVPVTGCLHFLHWSQRSKVTPLLRAHLCCSGNLLDGFLKPHIPLNRGPHCQALTPAFFSSSAGAQAISNTGFSPYLNSLSTCQSQPPIFRPFSSIICYQPLHCMYSSRHRWRSESS